MYIYLITNKANGKVYVGQTVKAKLNSYFLNKLWKAEHETSNTVPLFNAVKKYGREAFTIEPLVEVTDRKDLNRLEKHFVAAYKSNLKEFGYNATVGGDGQLGRITSEATKKKLSAIAKGKPKPEATKQRMRAAAAARTSEYKSALSALANQKRQEKLSPDERSALAKIGSDAALAKMGPYIPKPDPTEKRCNVCDTVKPIDQIKRSWSKSKRFPELGRWHYSPICKDCNLEYKRRNYAAKHAAKLA
jgi:group I intron endonuclease